ncbi:MAG TPA: CocE/NonD family hydrolase, partial [Gemmatimonadaceae bacterium]|nr:CocE/NonD family hydrolase [Gemmatimonadaceae bacterium]
MPTTPLPARGAGRAQLLTRRVTTRLLVVVAIATSLAATHLPAQAQTGDDLDRREVRIAARDGVTLYAVVVAPKAPPKPLPIMLVRTPYGVAQNLRPGPLPTAYAELGKDGYTFVFQDARGTGRSEGRFIM